jgi:glycosyltransferase 2 family protein
MKKSAILLLKLAVTVGVLGWLIAKVEPRTILATVQVIPPATLAIAVLLVVVQPLVAAYRWYLILRYLNSPLPLTQTLLVSWMAVFASALLPGGVAGDGVRMWVLSRDGVPPSKSINSVLLDRAAALTGLLLLVAATVPFVDDRVAAAPVRYGAAALLVAGVAVPFAIGLWMRLPARWGRFRAVRAFYNLSGDLRAVCWPVRRAITLTGMSGFVIACNSLNTFLLLRSLGAQAGLLDSMVLAPLIILVTTLPISFGGWGLREGSMVGLFGLIGVAPAVSLTVSILLGLLSTAVTLPGALVFLQWWRAGEPLTHTDTDPRYAGMREAEG